MDASNSGESNKILNQSKSAAEAQEEAEAPKSALLEKLKNKKKELASMEEIVRKLEKKWQQVQDNASKQPTPAQREKTLDKQLHSLIEQLAAKQGQAEGLITEIHLKEMELEKLNGLWRRAESSSRNQSSDYTFDSRNKLPIHTAGRSESLQRLMLLRSAFVFYILVLHILVFIKISF
ncbi:hypothetical protein CDL12_17503 [Handroanthus impetiginosus]|uniref:Uncharacterized protein n=1 Tax=Handroanthus impetiginosus TaxID=429701 RepID=A0A2G9GXI1_9LAMI|nr:hypothetical protein CDL12_17503 [Handroanthus impetiginosus]